jgi:RHS repeat-associated protein
VSRVGIAKRFAGRRTLACIVVGLVAMPVSGSSIGPAGSGSGLAGVGRTDPRGGWRPASERSGSVPVPLSALRPLAAGGVPRQDAPPSRTAAKPATRIKELTAQRSAHGTVYQLSDGRLEQELSSTPVHYRAGDGSWRPIDTSVRPTVRPGFVLGNDTNRFQSYFGADPRRTVLFASDAGSIALGVPDARLRRPTADGDTVTYADAFGPGVDLSYEVTAGLLKEKIVLAAPPGQPGDLTFRFSLAVNGLVASQRADGSIAFSATADAPPALLMPKPFMTDSAPDAASPYGTAYSGAVAQALSGTGAGRILTLTVDGDWLADPARRYPVVVDPTIKIAPTPTDSADTMILSDTPDTNYDSSWRLSVGTTETGAARSLLKFALPEALKGAPVAAAQLQVYYDQHHTTNTQDAFLQAHRVTADWSETTATWANASANVGELGNNTAQVDDGDILQHAVNGNWPYSTGPGLSVAVNGDFAYNLNSVTGETYTWYPAVTEPGTYRVHVHYVTGPDRSTSVPYTVNFPGGSRTYTLSQAGSTAAVGVWSSLGTHDFTPGGTASVVLGDSTDPTKMVVADAIKLVKSATAVRPAGDQGSHWHSYSIRSLVQGWLDGTYPNYGVVLKAGDETVKNAGGPRYEGSIYAYNGETATYPRLVITYGRPGVAVNPPRTAHATGAELSWPSYVDPCGWCGPADDIAEYQVHRSRQQTFTPTAATLVAPLPPTTLSYTDTTAAPTPADDPDPFGSAYYYMVAVKTKDGGLTPGATQLVRLPKAGRVTKIFQSGVVDTTLSSVQRDANLDRVDGQAWLSVGNNSATYGATRAAIKFPVSGIPATARVLDAEVKLWTAGVVGDPAAVWELHGLTRDFTETEATWNRASAASAWTVPGGDFTAAVTSSGTNFTNDPRRRNFDATALAQQWVATPTTNRGVLVKLANETSPASRAVFLSSEADEPELGPQLVVTYLETAPENTYYVPDTPPAVEPLSTTTIAATVTNTTTQTLTKADWVLSYRWTRPDGTPVAATQAQTPLPADLLPGAASTVAAQLAAPAPSAEGNDRVDHVLSWDLFNKTTGKWLSTGGAVNTVGALNQSLAVEESTSDQVGLESFYSYAGKSTGSGSTVLNNLHAGNAVWSYNAFTNPSRGLSTFVRLTYNSKDTSDSVAGYGWSLQASSIMRLGTPLDPHPNTQGRIVSLTDGDGTTHTFRLNDKGTADPLDDEYVHPDGVHLYLQRRVDCKPKDEQAEAWVMTRPDRTQFFFDCAGYLSSIVDNNGNRMQFVYEARQSNNQPTKFLRHLIDPTGRQTLTIEYYAKGEAYDYIDDLTWTRKSATNLTNPNIIDHVRQITDISGRTLTFAYTDKGLLGEVIDGAGSPKQKVFSFAYDMTQGNKNVKLIRVTDPRRNATNLAYYSAPEDDPKFKWSTKTVTDRIGGLTRFAYTDPDGTTGQAVQTVVTDAENHASTHLLDGKGRSTQVTDAKGQITKLTWDADNNVSRLEEPNGAATTYSYDPKTGYPLQIRDAEANAGTYPGTVLGYQTGLNGNTAELTSKTSPEGREWRFGYTLEGDLASVTDPAGTATATAGDFTTSYTYDTWGQLLTIKDANGNVTSFSDHHATGRPGRVTEPAPQPGVTRFAYDDRGNVTDVYDALDKRTRQAYDVFGRPLEHVVPKDQNGGVFITTPAPEYDANDNITRSTAPNGAVTDAVYDAADRLSYQLTPVDNAGDPQRKTSFGYDRMGNLLSQTEPKGNLTTTVGDYTTSYTYDEIYQLTAVTNALGHRLSYTYDNAGNVAKVVDPRKNLTTDTADFTTAFWYDLNHRVRVQFDALSKGTITEYDRDGLVKAKVDKAGNRTEILNDVRGKPVEVRVPHRNDGGVLTQRITRYEYDQVGNRITMITPRGVATGTVADDFVHRTVYDQLNRVKEQLTPYDPADGRYNSPDRTTYTYDAVGRVATVSAPPSDGQTVRNDTRYTYFDNGWTRTTTDPWDITTFYDYTDLGQQRGRILGSAGGNSSSRWMSWDYFPDGKLRSRSDTGVNGHVALVDNSDFGSVTSTGTWTAASAGSGYQGYDYRTHAAGAGTDSFQWTLHVPRDGNYDVYVKYPAVTGATTATYRLTHSGGTVDKPVNQASGAGTWVSIGRYPFTAGVPGKVSLAQSAVGVVVADSIKLVRDNTGETDNESAGFSYLYDADGNLTSITDNSPHRRVDSYRMSYTGLDQVSKVEEIRAGLVKNTTSFTYNPNGALEKAVHDKDHATYTYDVRDLPATVTNATSATDPSPKVTTFTYTDRGERLREVKGNGNTVDYTYFLDGLLRTQLERKPGGALVSQHTMAYDLNGNRTSDAARTMNADNTASYLDTTATYTYDPRDRVASLTRTGVGAGSETYVHDANNNLVSQVVKDVTTTYHYDRNRLLRVVNWSAGQVFNYNYDPFGRLDTVTAGDSVLERMVYDGFDHVLENRRTFGGTTRYSYDPLDRTATKTTDAGTAKEKTTTYNYLGMSTDVLDEEVAGAVTKSYQYSPWGERLSQVTQNANGTKENAYYGYNAHTDVETLTDQSGNTKATYGYTAYGSDDSTQFTGIDKPDAANPTKEPYNPYRFNAKRWDQSSGTYDMGFRDYSPGLNRFLSRDMYNGALADLELGTNPFTGNRYAFGAGNPVSNVELDGHWLLPGKLIRAVAKTVAKAVSSADKYKRQTKTIDDIDFRVRGYLSKGCIRDLRCPREEYRAQALAIRYANSLEGLGTDETSYYVDWEVRVRECQRRSCGRIDILKHYFDDDLIISEVKRYTGESTTTAVNDQLRRYERELRSYGLNVRRDPSFRNAHGTGVIGAFVDDDGRTNVVWAPADHIGHIYYAPVEELEDRADRGNEELEEVLENAEVFIENPLEEERDTPWWCGLCILS